jgi:hypothetical protein
MLCSVNDASFSRSANLAAIDMIQRAEFFRSPCTSSGFH